MALTILRSVSANQLKHAFEPGTGLSLVCETEGNEMLHSLIQT